MTETPAPDAVQIAAVEEILSPYYGALTQTAIEDIAAAPGRAVRVRRPRAPGRTGGGDPRPDRRDRAGRQRVHESRGSHERGAGRPGRRARARGRDRERGGVMTCKNCGQPIVFETTYWTHERTDRVTCSPGSEQCAQPASR